LVAIPKAKKLISGLPLFFYFLLNASGGGPVPSDCGTIFSVLPGSSAALRWG